MSKATIWETRHAISNGRQDHASCVSLLQDKGQAQVSRFPFTLQPRHALLKLTGSLTV
jgi:hypothetical protein